MRSNYKLAFSLMEMTLVLLVLSILSASGLSMWQEHDESSRTTQTNQRLDAIEQALSGFRYAHNRLPCPADARLKESEAGFGKESQVVGDCTTGSPQATLSDGTVAYGTIPTRALNLPDEYMYDGWGRRFSYYVDVEMTETGALFRYPADSLCAGAIQVNDVNGEARTDRAVYALVSHGENGHGAYLSSGARRNEGNVGADERANASVDTDFNDAIATALVQRRHAEHSFSRYRHNVLGTYSKAYDDILRYKERWAFASPADAWGRKGREQFVTLAAGQSTTCGITQRDGKFSEGRTYCWGANGDALGLGGFELEHFIGAVMPTPVAIPREAGYFHTLARSSLTVCAVAANSKAYCWGNGGGGALGNGASTDSDTPVEVQMDDDFEGWKAVVPGGASSNAATTCGISKSGKGYCWGNNSYGQLGIGSVGGNYNTPQETVMPAGETWRTIYANPEWDSTSHVCAITTSGRPYCWGGNNYGQSGLGSGVSSASVPTEVLVPAGVLFTSLSIGSRYTCGVGSDSQLYCWGQNHYGTLGDGTKTNRKTPIVVPPQGGASGYTQVVTRSSSTCALANDGEAYCWGQNSLGQLGDGTFTERLSPARVQKPADVPAWESIHSFGHTTCAMYQGEPWCWGRNTFGQAGAGSSDNLNEPAKVVMPKGVDRLTLYDNVHSGFNNHVCGIGDDGHAYCWGQGSNVRLGQGWDESVSYKRGDSEHRYVPSQVKEDRFCTDTPPAS